jgi:hypothetical protein
VEKLAFTTYREYFDDSYKVRLGLIYEYVVWIDWKGAECVKGREGRWMGCDSR